MMSAMSRHPFRVRALAAIVAILAIWAWQWLDFERQVGEHEAEFHVLGETVLVAAEGAAVRAARGGSYDPDELDATLEEVRSDLGAARLSIFGADDEVIAEARDAETLGSANTTAFRKSFVPLARRGGGGRFGRGGPGGRDGFAGLVPLPTNGVEIELLYPRRALDERIDGLRLRFGLTALSLSLAIAALTTVLGLRARSAGLHARLQASGERVAALAYLERLGAGLAHETRNPLAVVRGFAERLAGDDVSADDVKRSACRILEQTDRTLARLDEFLLLSRPVAPNKRPVDLSGLLRELAELLEPDLEAKDATISVSGPAVTVDADLEQIRRLFLNLLLNSAAAISQGGAVTLETRTASDEVRVVVIDDGVGVPENLRETLFEPYVTGRPGGPGLGLAISRRIATEHGWRLRYEPGDRGGTRMVVQIPAS